MQNIIQAKNIVNKSTKQYYWRLSRLPHLDIYLFVLSFCIISFITILQFPSLSYHAEVFAESGTNFFIHAYKDSIWTNLFIPDAGYLPLTQRLIALFIVKGFGVVALYPYITQYISIFSIALLSSLINLNAFKIFSPSHTIRFILGIAIGLISDYELHSFINFVYYGAVLLFLLIFVNKEKLSTFFLSFLGFISAIFIMSKGQLVVFLPAYILIGFFHFKRKEYRSLLYYFFTIVASLLQLFVMSQNGSKLLTHQSIGDFFYYVLKTIYYFFLTYKHVFLGYITKEKVTLLCFLLLFILFVIAIKKLIATKKYGLLSIFLIGNLIALSSLTLTVFLTNSNKNTSQKVTTMQSKIVTLAPSVSEIQKKEPDPRMVMTLYDDKHHANLRSLFIPNLLIFLSGIVILLTLLPKKSHQIVCLFFLFLASGAFGQIKVEEQYPTRNLSFSQWNTYYHLLENTRYCIPLNHYPFLLEKDCEMVLYKNENSLSSMTSRSIDLLKLTPLAKNWDIQGVILLNANNQFPDGSEHTLFAFDKKGTLIGKAKQLVPNNYKYMYYLFDKPLVSAQTLIWKNNKGEPISIYPDISLIGTDKNGIKQRIEY